MNRRVSEASHPGITALSVFFAVGALISFTAGISLLLPHSFLESLWRVNPRAHQNLATLGPLAILLMLSVSLTCGAAAIGLWRRTRWGYWLAVGLIVTNLLGDITNVLVGTEPRAIVGVPIAGAILIYLLSRKVRLFFRRSR